MGDVVNKMIKTEELTKVYNENIAVDRLSLEVDAGSVFGFLGPNGAGKTTTILMLTGMIEPTSGKSFINGVDVRDNPLEVKKNVGFLPEGVGFYDHLNAFQNLDYFASFYDMEKEERKDRIDSLLSMVGLCGVEQKVGGYSRGMKQRLGLAQALVNDPLVIFLDEPTSNLDPQGVLQMRETIKKLSSEGKTIFFSSHILSEVSQVCDTVGIISDGRLVERGSLEDIKKKMNTEQTVRIIVETLTKMPDLDHKEIVKVKYLDNRAIIDAKSDIREDISRIIYENNALILELRIEESSLEEIFMKSIYDKGGD